MKLTLVTILLSISLSAFANICTPSSDNCDAYLCMEQKHSCGYKGYPLRFGYRFCQNFLHLKGNTDRVNKWLVQTRYCLQDKLTNNPDYNCNNMFFGSMNDHVTCYDETGFCGLSKREKNLVKKQIMKHFLAAPIYILKNAKMFFKKACKS